jgi:micrococcal nuclease
VSTLASTLAATSVLIGAAVGCARVDAPAVRGVGVVDAVIDGDTIDVRVGGRDERVRLIGIDTPETKRPDTPVECFGAEASARTAALLPPGTEVRLERDVVARDDYGRLLAYVRRTSDGLFVNEALVRDGYAMVSTFPPNVAHAGTFVDAARHAERAGAGLWSACR